jgi:hypothetical protein
MSVAGLVLVFWALVFSPYPVNAAISLQYNGVNGATNCLCGVIRDCEINEPYDMRHFGAHPFRQSLGGPEFRLGSLSCPNGVLTKNICHSRCTWASAAIIVMGLYSYNPVVENDRATGKTHPSVRRCGENSGCQITTLILREFVDKVGMKRIESLPIDLHILSPYVGDGVNPTCAYPFSSTRYNCL